LKQLAPTSVPSVNDCWGEPIHAPRSLAVPLDLGDALPAQGSARVRNLETEGPMKARFVKQLRSLAPDVCFGSKADTRHVRVMSVIPLKADIHQRGLHVRYVPIVEIDN
jgi:hypothetical protein